VYQRIVVGVDGSRGAALAVDLAASLASLQRGRVTLVSVIESAQRFVSSRSEAARGERDARARLEEEQRSHILRLRRRGISVDGTVRQGDPREELLRVLRALSADLLVIGHSSDKAPGALGSDAARLARDAPCSVLIVPHGAAVPPGRIMVGYDGSPASAHALEIARSLSTAFGARLVIAAAETAAAQPSSRSSRLPGASEPGKLASLVPVTGDPAQGLLSAAGRNDAQLIVLGSTGIKHPWGRDLGATVGRVVRGARTPVLVVRLPTMAATVEQLMRREVQVVAADATVRDAATLLLERGIKSLPVVEADGRLVGIVTLGDLLRRAGVSLRPSMVGGIPEGGMRDYLEGLASRDRTCREIMSAQLVTVGPEAPAAEAVALLIRHHVKRLPVVDLEGRLVGIVSRVDLLRGLAGISEHDDVGLRRAITGRVASDVMQTGFSTVAASATIQATAETVLSSSVGRVAVVDEQERLVGVISTRDLLPLVAGHSFRELLDALGPGAGPREAFLSTLGQRSDSPRASDLMRRGVVSIPPDAPLDHVLQEMMSRGLKRLLVADRNHHLVGVVDRADIMRAIGPALSGTELGKEA
jgi:CBS domain-containing protein/nucleotide-binding universal stress UspA family protein